MSGAALAVGAGVGVLGYMTAQQRMAAQRAANSQNIAMTKEGIAEQARQFDITTGIGQEQFQQMTEEDKRRFEYGTDVGESRYGFEAGAAGEREASRRKREAELNLGIQGRFDTMRGENIARLDPYAKAGQSAQAEQMALLGLGTQEEQAAAMSRFGDSPGQKFMRDRAQKNLLRSSAAIGGLGGGNVRSALVEQGVGFAAQDYDRQLGRLSDLGARGFAAAGQQGAGQGFGPSYLTTGADVGIAETAYSPVSKWRGEPPSKPPGSFIPPDGETPTIPGGPLSEPPADTPVAQPAGRFTPPPRGGVIAPAEAEAAAAAGQQQIRQDRFGLTRDEAEAEALRKQPRGRYIPQGGHR